MGSRGFVQSWLLFLLPCIIVEQCVIIYKQALSKVTSWYIDFFEIFSQEYFRLRDSEMDHLNKGGIPLLRGAAIRITDLTKISSAGMHFLLFITLS